METKYFAEKRFFEWHEDDKCVSLRAQGGSYGGGSEVLIVEPIVFRDDITIKVDEGGVGFTLGARDFKGVQCVCAKYMTQPEDITTNASEKSAEPCSLSGEQGEATCQSL